MKILLVNPPRSPENNILKCAPSEALRFIHRKLIGPPLGLLTIASALKGHDVVLLEIKGEYDLYPDAPPLEILVRQWVEKYKPDVVGVTVITSEFDYAAEIFGIVRKVDPMVVTVAGGLHATLCPGDFDVTPVDVVIPGQSAHIFRHVVDQIEKKKPLGEVPGILLRQEGKLMRTQGKPPVCEPAGRDFLIPDRSLIRPWIDSYHVGNHPGPVTYVFTSLGCPYKCTFCSIWTQFRGKYHQRTVQSIIDELKLLDDYPSVRFADANTVVDEQFLQELFERISAEGIRKSFVMDIRADVAARRPDIIERLAKGGLKVVICGFESFRDEELKRYNKETPASYNQEAVKVFEENGIMVRGNYVIPCDYTESDFDALTAYADRNRVVYAGYTILTPMPGTLYYQEVKERITDHDYRRYNFFNAVLKTTLPYEKFHERVGALWLIKKGSDVI